MNKGFVALVFTISLLCVSSSIGGGYYYSQTSPEPVSNTTPATNVTPVSNTKTYSSIMGVDYPGGDIKYFEGSFGDCSTECSNTTGCIGYITHKDKGKNCWLKSTFANPISSTVRDTYYTGTKPPVP